MTLAGTLVVQHAELLAGLTYAQILRAGSEICFGSFSGPADMTSGKLRTGSPEESLIGIATQQLCDYCHICYGYGTAGLTVSSLPDAQAGYEKGISLAMQMLGGVEVIHDGISGLLGSAMIMNMEQLYIDHEYARMIARLLERIEVSDETMALDVIRKVGPGGSFLTTEHTLDHFRRELFFFEALDARHDTGSLHDARETAAERVRQILLTHRARSLAPGVDREIQNILENLPSDL